MMRHSILFYLITLVTLTSNAASSLITNAYGRDFRSLNGRWEVIVDLYDQGRRNKIYLDRTPETGSEFYEYAWGDGNLHLDVPGDWNSQNPELKYYEGTIWYGRHFDAALEPDKRQILYFNGVSYRATVYLNGAKVVEHEGSFTPFQVDVTDLLNDGDNFLVVEVNNRRSADAIPALAFDWWNYGGITRDVMLISTPKNYIDNYFVRLAPNSYNDILIDVALSDPVPGVNVEMDIPQLGKRATMVTDKEGKASARLHTKNLELWNPDAPRLYQVRLTTEKDTVCELIGFRNISTEGTKVLVNGKEVWLRCISFHEEIPQRLGRACTENDAAMLISEAKALGVNMLRLAHYPQNEAIVRMAEREGIMLWQEIPVWQGIDFEDISTREKATSMLEEMLARDANRCAVCFWGITNETKPSPARDSFLRHLLQRGRELDSSRLYTGAFDLVYFNKDKGVFTMEDSFAGELDMISINKYMGWYHPWPLPPSECQWVVFPEKPLFISEFGGEAQFGQQGDRKTASSWGEDYQEQLYLDNLQMFSSIPNLVGISPWILYDFRSPFRFHPTNQEGWNRKGLVSDRGQRKKAWYIINDLYKRKYEDINAPITK